MDEKPPGDGPWDAFGNYLRNQRHLAQLSLRQLADLTNVSNPYLSQIERGLHQPSIAIIKSLAAALNLSVSDLLAHAADIVNGAPTAEVFAARFQAIDISSYSSAVFTFLPLLARHFFNALRSGDGLRLLAPGERYRAGFSLGVLDLVT